MRSREISMKPAAFPSDDARHPAARDAPRLRLIDGTASAGTRAVPEEVAVALTYNGTTHAVMMASPGEIEAFALGFSLTEEIIRDPRELLSLEVLHLDDGIEARMWIAEEKIRHLSARRRALAGPTGCGLCGVESLAEAVKPAACVTAATRFRAETILAAMRQLAPLQALNRQTRAVHAAAFYDPAAGIRAMAEDVGRHNALDKLVGLAVRASLSPADGMVLLTSRVSVEMVQKAAVLGTGVLAAVSAPTSLAIRTADAAGITLCAVVRTDGFEVFTHPNRILMPADAETS